MLLLSYGKLFLKLVKCYIRSFLIVETKLACARSTCSREPHSTTRKRPRVAGLNTHLVELTDEKVSIRLLFQTSSNGFIVYYVVVSMRDDDNTNVSRIRRAELSPHPCGQHGNEFRVHLSSVTRLCRTQRFKSVISHVDSVSFMFSS